MQNEKKRYESPVVTKVEFDATDRITASACTTDFWSTIYEQQKNCLEL